MPSSLRRRHFLLASLSSSLAPAHARLRSEDIPAAVDRVIRPLMAAHDIPGMAVGVTSGGTRHLFQYGVASRESGRPVLPETLFEIGSLSKTFTATLACQAQALGKLSLDDSPAVAMPELGGTPIAAATLLHLGTYTAGGLPLQFPDSVKNLADAVAFYRAWKPRVRPGAQRRYSNPSIGLMGHASALAMQGSFTELVERELLAPLGLAHTFIDVPASRRDVYAWGYDQANRPVRVNPGVFDAQAYGVKTTAADMLRFLEANLDPAALPAPLRRAVLDTQVARYRVGPMVQGLGWEQYPFPVPLARLQAGNAGTMALEPHAAEPLAARQHAQGPVLFNKTGSTNGFGAYALFVPARRIGIVLLANRNIPNAARIEAACALLRQLIPK
ncbi:MAG TPA: class C beta-lactamase [Ramlibacter sp.]